MATVEPINLTQPENDLSKIAERERAKLLPKNDFKKQNQYSSTSPDALATGDIKGKGTGGYLDVYNQSAGNSDDVRERRTQIVINEYKPNKPYTTPPA
jgi:hypothetical protein